jgi:hypothetical protein
MVSRGPSFSKKFSELSKSFEHLGANSDIDMDRQSVAESDQLFLNMIPSQTRPRPIRLQRASFISKEDFRMSSSGEFNEDYETVPLTPTANVKSRTTSMGRPDLALIKNQRASASIRPVTALILNQTNDSISSNVTKPSVSNLLNLHAQSSSNHFIRRMQSSDSLPTHMRGEANPGCDNSQNSQLRTISPAPVSRFALRASGFTRGLPLNSNRVSLPFNRAKSFASSFKTLDDNKSQQEDAELCFFNKMAEKGRVENAMKLQSHEDEDLASPFN